MNLNPLTALLKTNRDLLNGRLHFPRNRLGEKITLTNGRTYTVFRQAQVDPDPGAPAQPQAVFTVIFHPAGLSSSVNRWFSLAPLPFCVGCPGFRSKLWMDDPATGECAGIYEWDTRQDAQNYADSYAMRFSKGRSQPGAFHYTIQSW